MVVKLRANDGYLNLLKTRTVKPLLFGNNISAISGATISVQSMTASVNHVFSSLKEQRLQDLINATNLSST